MIMTETPTHLALCFTLGMVKLEHSAILPIEHSVIR